MEVSGQLHALAALPPGKGPLGPRAVVDTVLKRKIPSLRLESNPGSLYPFLDWKSLPTTCSSISLVSLFHTAI
jgi:hypothetical protein